ncbi:MAG: hypothetical protein R3D57_17705 [Hyphomicrobiaceae bacterium]
MLRMLATVVVAGLVLAPPSSAKAGFLELANDEVSRDRHCDHQPCRRNGLVFKERYVKGRYLRYEIVTDSVEYGYQQKKVMVVPPEVGLKRRPGEYDYHNGHYLLVATDKPTTQYAPAQYEDVEIQILKAPAKHRVYRKRPYTAYYKDKAVVMQRCSVRDLFGFCLD